MKFRVTFFLLFLLFTKSFCQMGMLEVSYTKPFLDSKKLGEMSSPHIAELGIGWSGHGGFIPHGAITLGYIRMDDKVDIGDFNKQVYQSLMIGGKIGFRPLANVWVSRFQPIIQVSGKTTFKMTSENEETGQTEQFFSNGVSKVYEPAKITFLTGSLGFEYYLGQRFAINLLGNYDYIKINDNKLNNYSATIGIRQFF